MREDAALLHARGFARQLNRSCKYDLVEADLEQVDGVAMVVLEDQARGFDSPSSFTSRSAWRAVGTSGGGSSPLLVRGRRTPGVRPCLRRRRVAALPRPRALLDLGD